MASSLRISSSRLRGWIALAIFCTVSAASFFCAKRFSRRYVASTYLIGSLKLAGDDGLAPGDELIRVASGSISAANYAAIDQRFHPYSRVASALFPEWSAGAIRSKLVIENTAAGTSTLGAIRLSLSGRNPETVLGIATALASDLARPLAASPASPMPAVGTAKAAVPEPFPLARFPAPAAVAGTQTKSLAVPASLASQRRRGTLARRGADLKKQIQTEMDGLAVLEEQKQRINQLAKAEPPVQGAVPRVAPDPNRAALKSMLNASTRQLAALRERYTEDYPDVVAARERVQQLQFSIQELGPEPAAPQPHVSLVEKKPSTSQQLAAVDADETAIRANIVTLQQELAANDAQLAALDVNLSTPVPAATGVPAAVPQTRAIVQVPQTGPPALPIGRSTAASVTPRFWVLGDTELHTVVVLSSAAVKAIALGSGLACALGFLLLSQPRRPTAALARRIARENTHHMMTS